MPFMTLGLSDRILRGVDASGYTTPTPIQEQAIPPILDGRDIIGCAQTGTGKTAAFTLPLLDILSRSKGPKGTKPVRSLVLAPTRELALQVQESITEYGKFTNISCAAIFGGVSIDNQIKRLRKGVDVVVATPGRLLDHLSQRTIDLSHVSILVLDEADRMFDMGFIRDVRKIIGHVPAERQTLMFSATMSPEIRQLVESVQRNASLIEIGERRIPTATVDQSFFGVQRGSKMDLLHHFLQTSNMESVLVFSRTKHNADKIARRLARDGYASVALHSNRTQAQRQRALAGFRSGQFRILVATDIAARGIDVEGISHVINYDTPVFAEDYIHRIGRTGRAEASGRAITFVSEAERDALRRIERFIGRSIKVQAHPELVPARSPDKKRVTPQRSGSGKQMPRMERADSRKTYRNSRKQQRKPSARTLIPAMNDQKVVRKDDWRELIEKA